MHRIVVKLRFDRDFPVRMEEKEDFRSTSCLMVYLQHMINTFAFLVFRLLWGLSVSFNEIWAPPKFVTGSAPS